MRVVWLDLHDHDDDWLPEDPWDCELWTTVDVGDDSGSASFQIHVCTPTSIARFPDKRHCFLIEEYLGPKPLIIRLDEFIAMKTDSAPGDPYWELAHVWRWECGKYDHHGHLIG